ncbi:hypothetical protein GGU10DRAFT_381761 [Lentinula aff. detonsa]|uniref:Uncharacterized protein n=1 Tax=Lentinula aff. detonsa TaxID=2804958 RepID=A0AA38NMW6_9AGAR|nr:hypothetical protein GGU10DRAFT_381761 [Lentinula aff. detonsa]
MNTNQQLDLHKALTSSYSSDIVLLSALLRGKQPEEALPHTKNHSGLTFLSHLSMILTIGNTEYPTAESILAVSVFIDSDSVCCLIFVENNAPLHNHDQVIARNDMPYGPIGDTKEDYDVKQYDPNQENGRKLLEGGDAGDNFQSDAHLQDVFDILFYLSCIQDRKHKAKLFLPLQKFVHVRAFRKLGFRVYLFSTHWGKSPFDILHENQSTIARDPALTQTFNLALNPDVRDLVEHAIGSIQLVAGSTRRYICEVNPGNLALWTHFFQFFWHKLCTILLQKNTKDEWKVQMQKPEAEAVNKLVSAIRTVYELQKVLVIYMPSYTMPSSLTSESINNHIDIPII